VNRFRLSILLLVLAAFVVPVALAGCGQPAGEPSVDEAIETGTGEAGGADIGEPASSEMEGELGTPGNPIVMTFVPSGEMEEIVAGSDVVGELLRGETGLEIETNVATSYAAVIEAMGAGKAHVAWLPTLSYILAHERYGVEPILMVGRFGSTSYASQIIARADSGIESLEDLAGKSFCRSDPLSTSSWVVPVVMLTAAGVGEGDLGKIADANSHDGVVTAVYNGDCDAGATWVDARGQVEEEYPDVKDVVTVVTTSADIPNDNVSVLPSLPEDIVSALRDALVAIVGTDEGLEALGTLYGVETLEPADDTMYDEFRVTLDASGLDIEALSKE